MKDDGEYAVEKGERAHRMAALVVFVGWVVAAAMLQGGSRWVKMLTLTVAPVVWIWWPEVMAMAFLLLQEHALGKKEGRRMLQVDSRMVRWGAWLVLMVIPLVLFGSRKWTRDRERQEAWRELEHLQGGR